MNLDPPVISHARPLLSLSTTAAIVGWPDSLSTVMSVGEHGYPWNLETKFPRFVLASAVAVLFLIASVAVWLNRRVHVGQHPRGTVNPLPFLRTLKHHTPPSSPSVQEPSTLQMGACLDDLGSEPAKQASVPTTPIEGGKGTRSKERRRRGKEMRKAASNVVKKGKGVPPLAVKGDAGDTLLARQADVSVTTIESQDESFPASSRSSSSASRICENDSGVASAASHDPDDRDTTVRLSTQKPASNFTAGAASFSVVLTENDDDTSFTSITSEPRESAELKRCEEDDVDLETPTLRPSSSSPSEFDRQRLSAPKPFMQATLSSPSLKLDIPNQSSHLSNTPTRPSGDSPLPPSPYSSRPRKSNKSAAQTFPGPWDWDGPYYVHQPSLHPSYNKPPRFRNQPKNHSGPSPMSPMSGSISSPSYFPTYAPSPSGSPPPLPPPSSHDPMSVPDVQSNHVADGSSDIPTALTFPSLNPQQHTSSASPSPAAMTAAGTASPLMPSGHGNGAAGHLQSSPTPSEHSQGSNVSLSAHTQIASLKGALEAARRREEKSKMHAEKLAKECETLKRRWGEEVVAWRRREAELHAQISQVMHQLQTYAAFFVSMSGGASPQVAMPLYSAPQTTTTTMSATPPTPTQQQPSYSSTPALFPFAMPCPPMLFSPTSGPGSPMSASAPSPFTMYHSPQQNLFSVFFPTATALPSPSTVPPPGMSAQHPHPYHHSHHHHPHHGNNGNGNGSNGGTGSGGVSAAISRSSSSVESLSPSVSEGSVAWDRGRRPTRMQQQQQQPSQLQQQHGDADGASAGMKNVGGEDSEWPVGEDGGDGDGDGDVPRRHNDQPEEEGGEEVNGLLLDAILRRPESLGAGPPSVGAKGGQKEGDTSGLDEQEEQGNGQVDEEEREVVVTFPSLSTFGSVRGPIEAR